MTGRAVLQASAAAARRSDRATLALVLHTEGSTYVRAGAAALFGGDESQVGWLSGGCLEPTIAERAASAATADRLDWLELDTRDDDDLLSGSALGCRGRLQLALMPLRALPGWAELVDAWYAQRVALSLELRRDGRVRASAGAVTREWRLATSAPEWATTASLQFAPLACVMMFGAGPESALLLPLLRTLDWTTCLVERRPRWRSAAALADQALEVAPSEALAQQHDADAALVMHHHFERDREALEALATSSIPFVGLLGPQRRRDDLFKLLPAATREALMPRLRSPVGLNLGGQGAAAIALSIAAQLQSLRERG